ncbi:MAG: hypothetical protein A3K18_08175 [Lentisphaerae bacterium RIFOXYA12_64_32]|nr:MAG: hypothetical protein A3K18_08175 [Lentisphaerae bacterium RIFOXYA12_64_32]
MKGFTDERKAAVAGQFYPGVTERLTAAVEGYLKQPEKAPDGAAVRALIVPHAGYTYSGPTAGHAYALLRERKDIRRVVVIAPSHRVFLNGLSVGDYARFATPLGSMEVDVTACRALMAANPLITDRRDAHASEHALEVQLPFVQTVLPDATLVPLVCGKLDAAELKSVAVTLAEALWKPDTLWVISSDFTHYGEGFDYVPFRKDVPKALEELDRGAIDQIVKLDPAGFQEYVGRTGATICGRLPIAVLLAVLEQTGRKCRCELLDYTTSGRQTHDYDRCVSYASIAVLDAATAGAGTAVAAAAASESAFPLTDEDKALLLRLARESIRSRLEDSKQETPADETLSALLKTDAACFVSLHIGASLRGCIGCLEAREPLFRNVIRYARGAAFEDPRFDPVTAAELDRIDIELSVLTPRRSIASPEEFIIGKHGIILVKGRREAVFLPQVAPEQGWDRDTTLTHLALKAGLRPDDWRRDATFYVFEAVVFGEKRH